MFDGLKEKLGEFREDAADVAAEQATTEHEAQADSEAPDDSTATDDSTAGAPDGADESEGGPSLTDRAKSLATGKVILDAEDLEEPLWELELALLENDVEMSVAEEILDGIEAELVGEQKTITESTTGLIEEALREALFDVVSVGQFDFLDRLAATDKPAVIIFTGVNGVGKTTSIAKLATYLEEHGFSSVLANGDTYRAGANEQIEVHADRIDAPLISHEQGGDPAAVIYDAVEYANAHDIDVVLGDTAGRLHTSDGLMNQLAKIDRVVGPDMTLFVDEAVAGQDAVKRATEFNEAANI
ncbi:MAG: signal recognition particle receptor subunit alpha, partial [Halodesulfurarchaeum sp.]|nr:signal recognition particle receptor subunit alpha [Halodesulfurarchaeum sp.]